MIFGEEKQEDERGAVRNVLYYYTALSTLCIHLVDPLTIHSFIPNMLSAHGLIH